MLYYAKDHSLNSPFGKVLDGLESFLTLASVGTQRPVHASINRASPGRLDGRPKLNESIWLKRGFEFAPRIDRIMEKIRAHSDDETFVFGVRWIPNFCGPIGNSFAHLGIEERNGKERKEKWDIHQICNPQPSRRLYAQID